MVGIDLGKNTFHLHGHGKPGRELFHKKLSRQQMMKFFGNLPACTVVIEACAGSHFVAKELMAMGHKANLISPQFVRPFVKSNKNDFVMLRRSARLPHVRQCVSSHPRQRFSNCFQ